MISTAPALRLSLELRAAAYHFTVFGTAGVASVYFGIWLTHRGIEPGEIGILNAAPVFLMMAVNLFVGRGCRQGEGLARRDHRPVADFVGSSGVRFVLRLGLLGDPSADRAASSAGACGDRRRRRLSHG